MLCKDFVYIKIMANLAEIFCRVCGDKKYGTEQNRTEQNRREEKRREEKGIGKRRRQNRIG